MISLNLFIRYVLVPSGNSVAPGKTQTQTRERAAASIREAVRRRGPPTSQKCNGRDGLLLLLEAISFSAIAS